MPVEVGVFEAKRKFSILLERAQKGEQVIITRRGVPVAQLTSIFGKKVGDLSKVIEELKTIRGRTLADGENIRALIEEGRRY